MFFVDCLIDATGINFNVSSTPCGFGCVAEIGCKEGFLSSIPTPVIAECGADAYLVSNLVCTPGIMTFIFKAVHTLSKNLDKCRLFYNSFAELVL